MSNILLCQDLVHNYHRKGGAARCMMKLDLQKTYDTVSWSFLLDTLTAFNFPAMFVSWIKTCLMSAKFSIILNGIPCGFFREEGTQTRGPYVPIFVCNCHGSFDKEAARIRNQS